MTSIFTPCNLLKVKRVDMNKNWVLVSKMFYLHPYLGKIPNLTNIFQLG